MFFSLLKFRIPRFKKILIIYILLQIKCGNRYCHDGFYCYNSACYPRRPCTHHVHCIKDQFCDTYLQVCRKGVRRCSHQQQCGVGSVCKVGVCSKRECRMHKDCPGNDSCESGICTKYESYCHEGYNNYCKYGYACLNSRLFFVQVANFNFYLRRKGVTSR